MSEMADRNISPDDASRRNLMKMVLAESLPASIPKALAILADMTHRSIKDIEHVIFLMQENRSFDHYYGTLQDVRGYSDPRAAKISPTRTVLEQPDGTGGFVMLLHPDFSASGNKFLTGLPDGRNSMQLGWNNGRWNNGISEKSSATMSRYV